MKAQLHKVVKKRIKRAVEAKAQMPQDLSTFFGKVCLGCNRPVEDEQACASPKQPHETPSSLAVQEDARQESEPAVVSSHEQQPHQPVSDSKYVYRAGFRMPMHDK